MTFKIYPKAGGNSFSLTCDRFELKESRFVLYDSSHRESNQGFLLFSEVAAVVPDDPRGRPDNPVCFLVYLKNKGEPIEVFAHAFRCENERVIFLRQNKDMRGRLKNEQAIEDVYVATSELIAILPSDGLTDGGN